MKRFAWAMLRVARFVEHVEVLDGVQRVELEPTLLHDRRAGDVERRRNPRVRELGDNLLHGVEEARAERFEQGVRPIGKIFRVVRDHEHTCARRRSCRTMAYPSDWVKPACVRALALVDSQMVSFFEKSGAESRAGYELPHIAARYEDMSLDTGASSGSPAVST